MRIGIDILLIMIVFIFITGVVESKENGHSSDEIVDAVIYFGQVISFVELEGEDTINGVLGSDKSSIIVGKLAQEILSLEEVEYNRVVVQLLEQYYEVDDINYHSITQKLFQHIDYRLSLRNEGKRTSMVESVANGAIHGWYMLLALEMANKVTRRTISNNVDKKCISIFFKMVKKRKIQKRVTELYLTVPESAFSPSVRRVSEKNKVITSVAAGASIAPIYNEYQNIGARISPIFYLKHLQLVMDENINEDIRNDSVSMLRKIGMNLKVP